MAVVAALIYAKLLQYYTSEAKHTTLGALKERKDEFLSKANELVAIAYAKDAEKTLSLLENRVKRWGDRNIMQIAFLSPGYHLQAFIASKFHLILRASLLLIPLDSSIRYLVPNGCQCVVEKRLHETWNIFLHCRSLFSVHCLDSVGKIPGRDD